MICCTKRIIDTTGLVAKEDYGGSWISHTLVTEVRRVSEARYLHSKRAASVFHTKMSSLGTSKGILEIAKFALYVSVPITLMYSFAHNSEFLQKVVRNRSYVVYPPEGPRPPSPEELREMAREMRKNNPR
ncbi:hypothetical protein AAC387_Pa01g3590 [Persea americana]